MSKRWYRPSGRNLQATRQITNGWSELATLCIAIGERRSADWTAVRRAFDKVRRASPIGLDTPHNACLKLRRTVADAIFPRDRHYWTYDQLVEYGEEVLRLCAASKAWSDAFHSAG